MTEARLYVLRCKGCEAISGEPLPNGGVPVMHLGTCRNRDVESVEVLPADSVAELVQAADSLAGRVEDIVDTANWQKDPVTVARKLAVPLGKYQAARKALPHPTRTRARGVFCCNEHGHLGDNNWCPECKAYQPFAAEVQVPESLLDKLRGIEALLTAARHLLDCSQASERVCSRCGGKGVREIERGVDRGRVVMATIHCDACHGTGKTEPFEVEALRALERAVAKLEPEPVPTPDQPTRP